MVRTRSAVQIRLVAPKKNAEKAFFFYNEKEYKKENTDIMDYLLEDIIRGIIEQIEDLGEILRPRHVGNVWRMSNVLKSLKVNLERTQKNLVLMMI